MESVKVKEFLSIDSSSAFGRGSTCGYGLGSAYGFGSPSAYGLGYGHGYASACGGGSGGGSGDGSGSGYGSGFGSGFGSACGDGSGYGYASGYANASGYGGSYSGVFRIKSYVRNPVHYIDDIPTIIQSIRGNIAKCLILKPDLTTTPCFVVKVGNCFAHGSTIKEALTDAQRKHFLTIDEEERLFEFVKSHKWGLEYPDKDFYDWHNKLTVSCKMGRDMFAKEHGREKLDGKHTVEWFVELTKDAYGGEIIKRIPGLYKNKQTNRKRRLNIERKNENGKI